MKVELKYRKDIDGLRAIAVLLVVLFHVHPRLIGGGFVGVDVFFVISGFLITGLISAGLRDKSFTLLDFYARRIRRIFPALAIVLAACIAVGWFMLFPADYRNLGKHAAASAAFIANFTLLQDAGYFDAPSELKPVLHLWSLGIEEQFYILWPTLMLLTWRWRRAPIIVASAMLMASFISNVLVSRVNSVEAFFLPTTRFWELMVGCVLALGLPIAFQTSTSGQRDRSVAAIRDAASLLGCLLIIIGAILINSAKSFPGWWALLPTMGAALLIAAGPGALVNRGLLSRSPLLQLGLISYPLYLWHWPILAFIRHYHFKEPPDLMRWGGIILAVALASWTYQYVEKPIRRGAPIALKPIGATIAMVLLGSAGFAVFAEGGYEQRFPEEISVLFQDADNVAKIFVGSGLCVRPGHLNEVEFTADCEKPATADRRKIVVWGDSHGSNLVRGLIEIERTQPNIHLVFFATVGCPPIPSYPYTHPTLPDCPSANRIAVEKIKAMKPDTVILAGNWGQYDGGRNAALVDQHSIREVVDGLKRLGIKSIVGVGQFPLWDYAVPKLLARQYREGRASLVAAANVSPLRNKDYVEPRTFISDERVHQWFASAGASFVSPMSTLCNDSGCLMTVPGHIEPMERDEDHLTNLGSIWFVANNVKDLLGE
jgi:peptidoglycan/LPS O-acetylase OafA/YrhL